MASHDAPVLELIHAAKLAITALSHEQDRALNALDEIGYRQITVAKLSLIKALGCCGVVLPVGALTMAEMQKRVTVAK